MHNSDRSGPVFVPNIPAPATSKLEPNSPPSGKTKNSECYGDLLKNAKAKFEAAVSDVAESKKKVTNPTFWQMTARDVAMEVSQKAKVMNEFRSQLFKLEYPRIAATMGIPKNLTKKTCTKMLAAYKAKEGLTQTSTHDLIQKGAAVPKRQRTRKNKARDLKAKGVTAPTNGLAGGDTNDNPITID